MHTEATRLTLTEFENVANLKFVALNETLFQVETIRFAFTNAEQKLDSSAQAPG